MLICLKKKTNVSDRSPLIVFVEHAGKNYTKSLNIGETIDVEENLAYKIMSVYPNMFEKFDGNYKTKTMHPEAK